VQGTVVLSLCINAEGTPATGEIVQSCGNALLDKHALNWVLNHWRFSPARRNNTPCDARVSTTLHFTL
jgi:TonB family protein